MLTPQPLLSIGAKLAIPPHIPSRDRQTQDSSPRSNAANKVNAGIGLSSSWNGTLSIPKSNQPPQSRNSTSLRGDASSAVDAIITTNDREGGQTVGILGHSSSRLSRSGNWPASFAEGHEGGRCTMSPPGTLATSPRDSAHIRVLRTWSAVALKQPQSLGTDGGETLRRSDTTVQPTRFAQSTFPPQLHPQHHGNTLPSPRCAQVAPKPLILLHSPTEVEACVTGVEERCHVDKSCVTAEWIDEAVKQFKRRQNGNGRLAVSHSIDGENEPPQPPQLPLPELIELHGGSRLCVVRLKLVDRSDGQAALSLWIREAWIYRKMFPPSVNSE